MRWLAGMVLLALTACSYVEETREVGHKGLARINPYLAAERLLRGLGYEVVKEAGWPNLDEGRLAMVVVPASVLSAEGYVKDLERWTLWGGHTVVLLERGEHYLNDWNRLGSRLGSDPEPPEPLKDWIERVGWTLEGDDDSATSGSGKTSVVEVRVDDEPFEVWMESQTMIQTGTEEVSLVSAEYGSGRLTVVTDAGPFRNRYIGDYEHASLLARLAELSPDPGAVSFIRNASLSFWALLWQRAWTFVVGLLVLTAFWLWKNLPRFGPLDSKESGGNLRAYDRHLEALGDFHWRLDRGEGLLRPLRESLLERAHRLALAGGRADADVFELMAGRAGISRERAARAMTFERARDAGSFTRLVADLQKLHLSIP